MTSSSFWKVVGGVLFLAILIWAVQTVPEWQVRRAGVLSATNPETKTTPAEVANLENEMRKTDLQALGGLLAIIALIYTYRRVVVAEQGHITDRYTKAIEQLGALTAEGKPNVEVRLGAIYALERIAKDSPRDHWTIMEVLTAYVRQNAPAPTKAPTKEENIAAIATGPATEIQAILTVLGRRQRDCGREQEGQRLDLRYCDLRGADFCKVYMDGTNFHESYMDGARFVGAHMEGACFDTAHMEKAWFREAYVEGAFFRVAQLKGASFERAYVDGAHFNGAHVEIAYFKEAHVEGAIFNDALVEGANFKEAYVEGANFNDAHVERAIFYRAHVEEAEFRRAIGLTVEQFESAEGWEQAHFDEAFRRQLEAAKIKSNSQGKVSSEPET